MGDDCHTNGNGNGNGDFKTLAGRWLFSQGTSTVLLFAIAIGMWKGIPWLLEKQEAELKTVRQEFREERSEMRKDFLESLKKFEPAK